MAAGVIFHLYIRIIMLKSYADYIFVILLLDDAFTRRFHGAKAFYSQNCFWGREEGPEEEEEGRTERSCW